MTEFNRKLLFAMLSDAAEHIESNVAYLNELDGKTGDGDHGTTMLRVCHCIQQMQLPESGDWQKEVDDLGWAIMSQDGGSAGMLVGNLFIGIAQGLSQPPLSPSQIAATFRSGLDRMAQFSGAKQGDKTMLDTLIPAIHALEVQAREGASVETMFKQAALAAREGAEATTAMRPVRGRAKNMGDKGIGFIDPGATSMALLFESFNQTIQKQNG